MSAQHPEICIRCDETEQIAAATSAVRTAFAAYDDG